jgi:WD repeat-containing protein 48
MRTVFLLGQGVPYEMSLAAVKKYIWCKGEDLVFHFRVRDPAKPVPLPTIKPPGS